MVLLLLACRPEASVEPGREYEGVFQIETVLIDCEDASDWWYYDIMATGWGSTVQVEVRNEDPTSLETHELVEVDYAGDGSWSRWSVELERVDPAAQADGSSTGFYCVDKTFVTYAFHAWDWESEYVECLAWGLQPDELFPDCASLGATGH